MPMDVAAIDVQQITKSYDDFTLDPISFKVQRGEIMGLVGENGAGKTTLLSILLNRRMQDGGKVLINGTLVQDVLEQIGFVLDSPDFHGNCSPREIDYYIGNIYHQWDREFFFSMLERFGVDKSKKIDKMSRGTKSKTMLAIALAHSPKVLILDEVTSGLDPSVRHEILKVLKEEANNNDTTIVFSTHIPSDIEKIADFVCFLHKGKALFNLPIEQVRELYSKYHSDSLEDLMLALITKGAL